jgi:hypothetical protein
MPEYYNVIQASKYIEADPKTIRRWLKQGKITATRTDRGWLAIPEDQVERMKVEWENERTRFASPDVGTRESLDIPTRVEVLEQRVAYLEQALSNASLPVPTTPYTVSTTKDTYQPQQSHPTTSTKPKRDVVLPSDLPPGTLHSTEFAAKLGIKYTKFEGWMKNGVFGEQLERERIAVTSTGRFSNWFTPMQQEKAMEILKKHGKL